MLLKETAHNSDVNYVGDILGVLEYRFRVFNRGAKGTITNGMHKDRMYYSICVVRNKQF